MSSDHSSQQSEEESSSDNESSDEEGSQISEDISGSENLSEYSRNQESVFERDESNTSFIENMFELIDNEDE